MANSCVLTVPARGGFFPGVINPFISYRYAYDGGKARTGMQQ